MAKTIFKKVLNNEMHAIPMLSEETLHNTILKSRISQVIHAVTKYEN